MRNLLPAIAARGIAVDLLHVREHGPVFAQVPPGMRVIDLGTKHSLQALPALIRYLQTQRPTVLLSDKDRINRIALLARWLSGVPVRHYLRLGTTVSESLARRPWSQRHLQKLSLRHTYRFAHGILVPSEGVAKDLAGFLGPAAPPVHVVPSPIIRADLAQRAAENLDDPWLAASQAPLILGIGELSARKDYATLIRAVARLHPHTPCRVAILGQGREHARLQALARQCGIAHAVHLPGFVANPYPWLCRATLFIHTAHWEGLGIVLVEALALGTPVIATDCPSGPREVLNHGQYGALVPIGDDQALAETICAVLATPQPREQGQKAVQRYQVESATQAYLQAMGLD